MVLTTVILVVVVSLVIAAVLVLREAGRLASEPPPPVYDPMEAYDWVAERLPDLVAATLTPADVQRILGFQMEYFERRGVAGNGARDLPTGSDVVIGGSETVDYILERARDGGEDYLPEQVHPVVEIQWEYLRAIGALGGPV